MLTSWNETDLEDETPLLMREELHGWLTVETVKEANVFPRNLDKSTFPSASQLPPHRATENDLNMLKIWQSHLNNEEETASPEGSITSRSDAEVTHTTSLSLSSLSPDSSSISAVASEKPLQAIKLQFLNMDQRRVYDIVA